MPENPNPLPSDEDATNEPFWTCLGSKGIVTSVRETGDWSHKRCNNWDLPFEYDKNTKK